MPDSATASAAGVFLPQQGVSPVSGRLTAPSVSLPVEVKSPVFHAKGQHDPPNEVGIPRVPTELQSLHPPSSPFCPPSVPSCLPLTQKAPPPHWPNTAATGAPYDTHLLHCLARAAACISPAPVLQTKMCLTRPFQQSWANASSLHQPSTSSEWRPKSPILRLSTQKQVSL